MKMFTLSQRKTVRTRLTYMAISYGFMITKLYKESRTHIGCGLCVWKYRIRAPDSVQISPQMTDNEGCTNYLFGYSKRTF